MIYGPIVPRTADGLSEVVLQAPERLEGGLETVVEGLRLGEGILVDAIARDASGLPVLLFLAPPPDDRSVPVRVTEALSWFDELGAALHGVLQQRAVRLDGGVRAIVACFDLTETTLRRLRDLEDNRISVLRLEPFQIGTRREVGVVPLLDRGRPAVGARVTDAGLPEALDDFPRAHRFLDLVDRLDPTIEATGDRYRRTFSIRGVALATLGRLEDVLEIRIPGNDPVRLKEDPDVARAFDQVARRYLAAQRQLEARALQAGPTELGDAASSGPDRGSLGSPRFAATRSAATPPRARQATAGREDFGQPERRMAPRDVVRGDHGAPAREERAASEDQLRARELRSDDEEFADSCGTFVEAPEKPERREQREDDGDFDLPILEP